MILRDAIDSLDESIESTIKELKETKGKEKKALAKTLKIMAESRAILN